MQIDNSGNVWFDSFEKLTEDSPGDGTLRGGIFEVYERHGETTKLVSRMPDGSPISGDNPQHTAAGLLDVSPDGRRLYISTEATLSPEDGDGGNGPGSSDDYELTASGARLITTGPLDGPFPNPNPFDGSHRLWASDDGSRVYFETGQRLSEEDTDQTSDIYVREGSRTRLVSSAPTAIPFDPIGGFSPQPSFLGVSTDGATAFFATIEQLTPDDTEKGTSDIYSWHDGVTRRVTDTVDRGEGPGVPHETFDWQSFGGAAEDGTLFFAAHSPQSPEDTDNQTDLYAARPDGTLQLLTTEPERPGETPAEAALWPEAASRDGTRVFFSTYRQLLPEDRDHALDVYMWTPSGLRLITPGTRGAPGNAEEVSLDAISRDGHRAFFTTYEQLSPQDTDDKPDVYEWHDGAIRLVSPASDGRQTWAFFRGISPNGRYVAFSTFEQLVPGDNDAKEDIYVIDMGPEAAAGSSSLHARPTAGHGRRTEHRLRLVTAESIPPRMAIARAGTFTPGAAHLRLRCPKQERSGPCHGQVRVLSASHSVLARGSFQIETDHGKSVVLHGNLPAGAARIRATARVRGVDRLGNAAVVSRSVTLHRAG